MESVPTYALYGESEQTHLDHWMHCESIAARSARFDWRIKPHRHRDFFQILHLSGGSGAADLDDGAAPLIPPVAVTIPPRAVHGFRFSRDVEGNVITLLADRAERMLQPSAILRAALAQPRIAPLGDGAISDTVALGVSAVAREYASGAPARDALIEAHLSIVLLTLGRLVCTTVAPDDPSAGRLGRRAAQFRMLLDREYRRRRPVAYYAERLAMSETHLNRICRRAFGQSALDVINARVILEATRELTFTLMSVKEVAFTLGFQDPAYFTRFFTRHVGLTPSRFQGAAQRRAGRADQRSGG
jgi:AraC family transcriptional regulator, transcriptional activator of pobA